MMKINVANSFSAFPGGRVPSDGPYCGKIFREDVLAPALKAGHEKITVDIEGVEIMGSSFIDEAFGGLLRDCGYSSEELMERIKVSYQDPELEFYANEIYAALSGE